MLRIGLRLLALVFVLLIVLVGGVFFLSGERLAKLAGDQLTATLGRDVKISDELRPQLFPNIGVRSGAFEIAGADDGAALIAGDGLSVSVDLWALFSRRVDVKEVTLVSPTLTLVKDADGRTNWSSGAASNGEPSTASSTQTTEFALAGLSIQDGTVRFRDDTVGRDMLFENVDITAAMPNATAPLVASFSFVSSGQAASGDAELTSLAEFLAGNMTGLSLSAQIAENSLSFIGDISSQAVLEGDFSAALPAPDALMTLAGNTSSALPTDILPIEASGSLGVTPDTITIGNGSYRLGDNSLQGPVSVALGDVPFLSAQLSAASLDLSFLSADEGSANADANAPAAAGKGWSTDPIDASALSLLNADVLLDVAEIDLGTTTMQDVTASVTIDNARAVAKILKAQAFGGALVGQFVANNRNGLSVAGEMDGKTVAIQALLTDMAGFDRMRGAGNTQLSFLGVGQSLDQIMRSLSGNGALDIGQGDITGFDLASLFGGSDVAGAVGDRATTIFQSLAATFTIDNGVMRNTDLLISANLFEATGSGEIDLGRQTLDYLLRPRVFENDLTGGLSVPVRIDGTWANPRIYPDLKAVAQDRLRLEEEKLRAEAEARLEAEKQSAKEKANARLEKEKEKLEDKLEDKLRKGLGSLFD